MRNPALTCVDLQAVVVRQVAFSARRASSEEALRAEKATCLTTTACRSTHVSAGLRIAASPSTFDGYRPAQCCVDGAITAAGSGGHHSQCASLRGLGGAISR